jgi:hypothetical protein
MLKPWLAVLAVGAELSITVTVTEKFPALSGVPPSVPVLLFIVMLGGNPVAVQP